mmetsp:Transcript_19839/g.57007  ORF Transcript_19839/g.57007 Transcript_19839/m.57007 type:complete len:200 (+) Transcript_19839:1725-2324(+)
MASFISAASSTATSTAGSVESGASPGFVSSAADPPPPMPPPVSRPFPAMRTVFIPRDLATRIFFIESSTMTHSCGFVSPPNFLNIFSNASRSGLHAGSTSSTANTMSSGNISSRPIVRRTRSTYVRGPFENATRLMSGLATLREVSIDLNSSYVSCPPNRANCKFSAQYADNSLGSNFGAPGGNLPSASATCNPLAVAW